ncbi:DNA methyltransferase [Paenibacillus sp. TAF43_2]|uniref:DNA methyltransferase n=1 Tax=Paenibacillus sp. TAF43_2 TaxID=3233069 RepID=UPI003F999965
MPEKLTGAPVDGHVLDPFGGSGTTLKVALENNRECTIIELGEQYVEIAERRIATVQPKLQFEGKTLVF